MGSRYTRVSLIALIAVVIIAAFALIGCTAQQTTQVNETALLSEQGLDGLDARDIITKLDEMPVAERPNDMFATVQHDTLDLIFPDEETIEQVVTLPLPQDEFYVSIAPYAGLTHDCFYHSLTTCVGELSQADVHVTVTDTATGETVYDAAVVTYDNGFFGIWLPAEQTFDVSIVGDAGTAVTEISTGAEDPTCITTAQLS